MRVFIKFYLLIICLIPQTLSAQLSDFGGDDFRQMSEHGMSHKILSERNVELYNADILEVFFKKLSELNNDKNSKVRIVNIGDSHIQAGIFTGNCRDLLQGWFGNAGLGFVFPHHMAGSNGIKEMRFSSTARWKGIRNIHAAESDSVGLSGFSLTTDYNDFIVQLKILDERYYFNTLKVCTPESVRIITPALSSRELVLKNYVNENKKHRIKSGENLSVIAREYGVSVKGIKTANGLKSDMIRAGASLVIPQKTLKHLPVERKGYEVKGFDKFQNHYRFYSPTPLEAIWVLSDKRARKFALSGFILENDHPGVIYSGIGVNGARFSDYNKTPLFFKQLNVLEPDLLIISLGTNEAHDEMPVEKYLDDLLEFIHHIRKINPDVPLLFTTPPPSLLKRRYENVYSESYARNIIEIAMKNNFAVWDQYTGLGGRGKVRENYEKGLVSKDFIHYTREGYAYSADLFVSALMRVYISYLIEK